MNRPLRSLLVVYLGLACSLGVACIHAAGAEFNVDRDEAGVVIKLDGKLLTKYLIKSGHKPIFWPVIGPNGEEITRAHPMVQGRPNERSDHVHHRSFWFTHGDVNGIDFWSEGEQAGHIVHREITRIGGGKTAVIETINDWVSPRGEKQCEDKRTFTFASDGKRWWVDCDITVTASEGKVKFGDTKEGSFGVRVAGTMKVDKPGSGTIVNSEGQTNREAWGKPAAWVDYYGPLGDEVVGVAILNHPTSFRHPTYWHVRTYGLFTANPFGLHHFKGSNDFDGSHTMEKGESFTLRHRVLFHHGDEKMGRVAEAYAAYAQETK